MSRELETKINRLIGKVNSVEILSRIERKCRDRRELMHKRRHKAEADRIWTAMKSWRPGDVVKAGDEYKIFDMNTGPQTIVDKGSEWVVWHVQPRARVAWLIPVNGWDKGITYAVELAAHIDRLRSLPRQQVAREDALRETWDHARKKSIGFEVRQCGSCEFTKIELHETFGADSVDRETEQA